MLVIIKLFTLHFPAFLTHGALQVVFLLWSPNKDQEILFYVFAGLWGMGDAVIQTQLNGQCYYNINISLPLNLILKSKLALTITNDIYQMNGGNRNVLIIHNFDASLNKCSIVDGSKGYILFIFNENDGR